MVNMRLLDWDSDVLDLRVARIDDPVLDQSQLEKALTTLRHDGVDCVYWPSKSDDIKTQDAADACEGVLADIKVTYTLSLEGLSPVCGEDVVEYVDREAMPDLIALAFEIGECSRFYLDKKMPADAYQKVYCRWMENAVNRSIADCVKVIKVDEACIGVVTLKKKGDVGIIDLVGVDPSYRGQGLAMKLINAALAWCKEEGLKRCEVVTQFSNDAACALYEKNGFTVKQTEHFYHFWLN
jgi:GNAT superfamily N-acetyltransferase